MGVEMPLIILKHVLASPLIRSVSESYHSTNCVSLARFSTALEQLAIIPLIHHMYMPSARWHLSSESSADTENRLYNVLWRRTAAKVGPGSIFFQSFNVLAEPPALAPMRHRQTDSIQMNRGCVFPHGAEVSLNADFKFKTIANNTNRKC